MSPFHAPGLWRLLPGDNHAMIDGQPVPLIDSGQKTRIPESCLANVHRSGHWSLGGLEVELNAGDSPRTNDQ